MEANAEEQGSLWGSNTRDWAEIQQPTIRPASLAILNELEPWRDRKLLDIGCGAGDFLYLAHQRGAITYGLDPSIELIQWASKQSPCTDFRRGEADYLPYPDGYFDVTTAVNSLHFSTRPHRAIEEMVRVTRKGGALVTATWGPPGECDAVTFFLDLGALLPLVPPLSADGHDLTAIGTHIRILTEAGLTPSPPRVISTPWCYPDLGTALRGLLSIGPAAAAIRHSGRDAVVQVVTESIAPYRQSDGSYVLNNTCHYLTVVWDFQPAIPAKR